ncbi:MAG: energy transducer TonB [Gammaproteobacteria bacterium]|nr:energy transducer TonB [Gammaproteobacteria bacterium]
MLRTFTSLVAALGFSLLSLLALKSVIDINNVAVEDNENLRYIDFVRLKKEQTLQRKERVTPKKKEPPKKPPKPKVDIPKPEKPKTVSRTVQRLAVSPALDLSASSILGDAMVAGNGQQAISTNVIPLVRINPVYPRRARTMKKEGYVKLEFTITTEGTVKDVEIVESDPPKLFDSSAERALLKWKFRAKIEDNRPIEQRAMVQINFKLDR